MLLLENGVGYEGRKADSRRPSERGPHLADHHLVLVVVAGEVGEDAGGTGHHVDVIRAQQPDQGSQKSLHALLKHTHTHL